MKITGHTQFYALLAHPVEHVKTPELHNRLFADRGLDVAVVPIEVEPGRLATTVEALRSWSNFTGFGVTIPHKEAVVGLVDEVTEPAALCGATNVVRRDADGTLVGTQLDGAGMLWSLERAGYSVAGASALVAGAGGTAKGIAFELAARGVSRLSLTNRTLSRAEDLAVLLRKRFPRCEIEVRQEVSGTYDFVINATSLGMRPDDALPVPRAVLTLGTVVADVVMTPAETALLIEAEQAGCHVHPGLRTLEFQFEATVDFLGLVGGADD